MNEKIAGSSAERVRAALAALAIECEVRSYPASTRTAAEAAAAIGCDVAQIVKSLVFRAASGRPVLALVSRTNRVDERRLAAVLGQWVGRADADFVRRTTGFTIGGVAPVGHLEPPVAIIDRDLTALGVIWAAAGTPNSVFRLTPAELERASGGRVADIKAL